MLGARTPMGTVSDTVRGLILRIASRSWPISLSGKRVARELDVTGIRRGLPMTDNGPLS